MCGDGQAGRWTKWFVCPRKTEFTTQDLGVCDRPLCMKDKRREQKSTAGLPLCPCWRPCPSGVHTPALTHNMLQAGIPGGRILHTHIPSHSTGSSNKGLRGRPRLGSTPSLDDHVGRSKELMAARVPLPGLESLSRSQAAATAKECGP